MEVFLKIVAYVIAFVCLAAIEIPFFPITWSFAMVMRKMKWLGVVVALPMNAIKVILAILFSTWLIIRLGSEPGWLMFIIPGLLMYRNDMWRVRRAQRGTSNVRKMLELNGEEVSYNQRHDVWMEMAHLGGDVVGWIIGSNLWLHSAKLF